MQNQAASQMQGGFWFKRRLIFGAKNGAMK